LKNEIIKYAIGLNATSQIIKWIKKFYINQDQSEVEHIIDFMIYKNFINPEIINYELMNKKTKKWIIMLTQNILTIDEVYGEDIEIVLDFNDGFRFVKLLSKNAYVREGGLMTHCVSSYFSREVNIYSLRDSFNKPHCTIEQDKQIKGKGNGSISLKYINYVVKFLEWTGMKVRNREMSNLGYAKVEFPDHCLNKLFKGCYIPKNEKVKYYDEVVIFNNIEEAVSYKGTKICLFSGNAYFSNSKITSEDIKKLKKY
jgi:hypothetical protein